MVKYAKFVRLNKASYLVIFFTFICYYAVLHESTVASDFRSVVSRLFRPRATFWVPKTWRAAASIASSWPLGGNCWPVTIFNLKMPFFPFVRNSRPGGGGANGKGGRGPHFTISRAALQCSFLDPRRATIHDVAGRIWPAGRTFYITALMQCKHIT